MVIVRRATPSDGPGIAKVHVETWQTAYASMIPHSALLRMSEREKSWVWSESLARERNGHMVVVAEEMGAGVVGFGSCGRAGAIGLPYEGEVYMLYVLPDYQDNGIGRALLRALFEILRERGFTSALIWVLAENPARFFYQAMGGQWVAVREERLWGATLREVAYGWPDLKQALAPSHPRESS